MPSIFAWLAIGYTSYRFARLLNAEKLIALFAAWFAANTFEAEKAAVRRLNKAAFDHVVYAPLGFFLGYQAWRKNVSGIVKGPFPFFWGVSKTA